MRRFLHLSDIHFCCYRGDPHHDVDAAVRSDLLEDLRGQGDRLVPADAVLVVGDISARGQREEFDLARAFLDEVCEIAECDPKRIACVPGNHDIDRGAHEVLHDGIRQLLRTVPASEIAARVAEIFAQPAAAQIIHRPLEEYNQFALPLAWSFTDASPTAPGWDMDLGGLTLRIRGVNSALVSDDTDDHAHDATRLVLGSPQLAQLRNDRDKITILMCHHPRRWIRDADYVEPWLARAHILLTGHEHEAGIVPHPDGRSVTIESGAVNPDRSDSDWQPAYNILELDVDGDELVVKVFPRCYARHRAGFGPDERWPDGRTLRIPISRDPHLPEEPPGEEATQPSAPVKSDERAMIYAILSASPDSREQAARALGLLEPDQTLRTSSEEAALLERARSAGKLPELAGALGHR